MTQLVSFLALFTFSFPLAVGLLKFHQCNLAIRRAFICAIVLFYHYYCRYDIHCCSCSLQYPGSCFVVVVAAAAAAAAAAAMAADGENIDNNMYRRHAKRCLSRQLTQHLILSSS